MGKSCRDAAEALTECMLFHSKSMKNGATLMEALRMKDVPAECEKYRLAYFECRRGQWDMRNRIRGPRGGSDADAS